MALSLSPAKLLLLAVHFAVKADVASLSTLAAHHGSVLRKDLLLRILLTYLPETLPSTQYTDFIRQLESGSFPDATTQEVDYSSVEGLTEDEAAKKVRRLRLLQLALHEGSDEAEQDALTLFLARRSYKVDEEAGLLDELPALLLPFLDHSPCVRALLVSTILPLLRRNCEYYPLEPIPHTLQGFRDLPDRVALNLLLSQTGVRDADLPLVGRDLRGLVGPWLLNERRWKQESRTSTLADAGDLTPGWDEFLRWLTAHASKNWRVAVNAIQQWGGPRDADLAGWGTAELTDDQLGSLEQSYARAALASAYLIPEPSIEALEGAYTIISRISTLRELEPVSPLASALVLLPPLSEQIPDDIMSGRNATYMRNDLLGASNSLTAPTDASIGFLQALILSAHILTKAGCPCTIRRAGELALLQDEREQKAEAVKLIHSVSNSGPKTDDKFWIKARNEILWLSDWGAEDGWSSPEAGPRGIFSQVKREFLEVEILKALLSNTRYSLARSIYEDTPDQPLNLDLLRDTIYATAMTAYDNASNPNRTRGGLKKCDDIIKAFPKTIQPSDPRAKQIDALLQATHALSDYRLVLKQGEPFTPVVLRVHADPISIIGKILEQNPKSYTHLHGLLDLGNRMVQAGLTPPDKTRHAGNPLSPEQQESAQRLAVSRRITAMCIDAALTEDDFETAYSYVVNRLSPSAPNPTDSSIPDDYSWKAALQAGKYRRTSRTLPPTHLGMSASANASIRHLEQRIECLATALRIAPAATLQEILNAFRRAEEELDAAVREEMEKEEEWDARGDALHNRPGVMPGAFGAAAAAAASTAAAAVPKPSARQKQRHADEDAAPMSLFDLSRASVLSAQRNLSALSGLQKAASFTSHLGGRTSIRRDSGEGHDAGAAAGGRGSLDLLMTRSASAAGSISGGSADGGAADEHGKGAGRVRKRDQLREAAMGTLVSGVGWLVGAQPPPQQQ
ncbi:hypothetical protein VTK26DRAFT_6603 [Humicola hyalothermophila]